MNSIKEKLYKACEAYVDERIKRIEDSMAGLESDLENETKSSAGDKYETGRAMAEIELDNANRQLSLNQNLKTDLNRVKIDQNNEISGFGSLILTTSGHYLIAIGLGEVKVEGDSYFCISPGSPIGEILVGKKEGEKVLFRDKEIKIEKII